MVCCRLSFIEFQHTQTRTDRRTHVCAYSSKATTTVI